MDDRRKRLLFRANHRGMKEADVMLGGFAHAHLADLTEAQVDRLELLLEELDVDIMDWVIGKTPVPEKYDTDIFAMILKYKPYA
jgi:antitoxin CptB